MPRRIGPVPGLEHHGDAVQNTTIPGQIFIPTLGRSFQLSELRDAWVRWDANPPKEWSSWSVQHMRRLESGREMVWHTVMWAAAPDDLSTDDIRVRLNAATPYVFPKPVVRMVLLPVELRRHMDELHARRMVVMDKLLETGTLDENVKQFAQALMGSTEGVTGQGVRLRIPVQIRDSDDIRVEGVSSGSFFLYGVEKFQVGR